MRTPRGTSRDRNRLEDGVFRLSCGLWRRRPSPVGVLLTVSRSLTEAQRHRGGLGEEEG
jgi:hypothetical protein